jgi:hypothetical protein
MSSLASGWPAIMASRCFSNDARILVRRVSQVVGSQAVGPAISQNFEVLLVVLNTTAAAATTTNNNNNSQVCSLFTLFITVTSKGIENQLVDLVVSNISHVH